MLILDKQKAVEHMVALTAGAPDVAPEARPARQLARAGGRRSRSRQRVATFERRVAHIEPPPPPTVRRNAPELPSPGISPA